MATNVLDIELSKKVLSKFDELRYSSESIRTLISMLEAIPNVEIGIFGGAARDWWLDKTPKDIDLVISAFSEDVRNITNCFKPIKNGLGGNTINVANVLFDIWPLCETNAFVSKQFTPSWDNLVKSVPFNTDTLVVLTSGRVYTNGFWPLVNIIKEIEFVNRVISNKQRIAERAVAFSYKYGWKLSPEVGKFCKDNLFNEDSMKIKEEISDSNKTSLINKVIDTDDDFCFPSTKASYQRII